MSDVAEREYGTSGDWYFFIALTLFQMVLWGWLYRKDAPLRAKLHAFLERDAQRKDNLLKNGYPEANWSFWMIVSLHHSLGGFCALAGLLAPSQYWSVLLVRIGLSFEIGEDFLHYLQMLQSYWSPPGNEMFGVMFTSGLHWLGVGCHHAVGSVAGSFVFVYIPYVFGAQFCCALLLLSAVPNLIQYPFLPYTNLRAREVSCLGRVVALLTLGGTAVAMWGRIFLFPPVVLDLVPWVSEQYGEGVANVLFGACALFMIFVLAGLFFTLRDLKDAFKAMLGYGPAEEKSAYTEEGRVGIALSAANSSFMLTSSRERFSRRSLQLEAQQELAVKSPTAV